MAFPYTFETGIPVRLHGRNYLLYEGELLPTVSGGIEPPEKDDESETPPAQPDLQTILAAVTKEVGKAIKQSLKPIEQKLTTIDTWRTEVDARFRPPESDEGEVQLEIPGTETPKVVVTPADGALKKQLRELNEQVANLKQQNQEAQARTQEITQKERVTNRDRLLADSLNSLGVVSLDGGIKLFKDDLVFDEDTEEWSYSTRDGARYTIPEMVQKFTPDWLKKPLQSGGGSGGGKPTGAAAQKAEVARVKALFDAAQKSSSQGASMAYWRARRDALAKGVPAQELDQAVS